MYRKFLWLAEKAKDFHEKQEFLIEELQFDEMESIEHTKLKPLTVAVAVNEKYHYPQNPYQTFPSYQNKEKRRLMKYTNLEKKIFDPILATNRRVAKFRNHIKRLTRRSWCTTKIKDNLEKHLYLYIADNNGYRIV